MKTIKVSEATNQTLDWLVAKCEGRTAWVGLGGAVWCKGRHEDGYELDGFDFVFKATDPSQAWPIIDRERLCLGYSHQSDPAYCPLLDPETICWARTTAGGYLSVGPTPLIAAMRCFCRSKIGNEVEVPEELCSPST